MQTQSVTIKKNGKLARKGLPKIIEWLEEEGYATDQVETENTYRFEQHSAGDFYKESYRTLNLPDGISLIRGVKKI